MTVKNITFDLVSDLEIDLPKELPVLPDDIYQRRLNNVRYKMREHDIDSLIVYADREHFSTFNYLVGFEPRFEEGLLVIHKNDPSYILLGRECFSMHELSKIEVKPILYTALSIPNNMRTFEKLEDLLSEAAIKQDDKVGVVGWKLFEDGVGQYSKKIFDVPSFVVSAVSNRVGGDNIFNVTSWFIEPDNGLRTINNADEIAYFEYGATWASEGIKRVIQNLEVGMSETELANYLPTQGLPLSCHPMVSSGERATLGLVSPSSNRIKLGDPFTTCFGLQGGLSCRAGYVANAVEDLPENVRDYIDKIVKPFYGAVVTWYEKIGLGVTGGDLYDAVQSVFPSDEYGWWLNPGHLISSEEYISSPIYEDSKTTFKSGQIVQMDIIPASESDYYTTNVEDGVVIADKNLRNKIRSKYPEVWKRMQLRRMYMMETLGIYLKEEILPMSNLAGLLRPLLLNKEYGMKVVRS